MEALQERMRLVLHYQQQAQEEQINLGLGQEEAKEEHVWGGEGRVRGEGGEEVGKGGEQYRPKPQDN